MFRIILTVLVLMTCIMPSYGDGLMMPTNEDYPKDFLRNRLTRATVNIHGIVAETYVYQEFVNEWSDSTDAVYSFPLPPEARATEFIYWYDDNVYKAVLREKEQAVNPGTGQGGVAALVNHYIGRNGIKVVLKNIPPGKIQRVQLHYISLSEYYNGKCTYTYPLNTEDFVNYPVNHLQFSFYIVANAEILNFDIPTHPDYHVISSSKNELQLEFIKPKAYLSHNLEFYYKTTRSKLGVDFYSANNDTSDGHFALFIRPPNQVEPDGVFPKRVFFLLGNSSQMFGYKLNQSITSISKALDLLSSADQFNIILFNHTVSEWKNTPQVVSPENIQLAKDYLSTVNSSYGSQMDLGIKACLDQIPDDSCSNSILVFTDGFSPIDPREIDSLNVHKAGIFPIGIGDRLSRARLEMTAALNYGFVTYLNENANLSAEMIKVFQKISQPILKDVALEYGRADLSELLPKKIPTTYAGSYFFTTGRYRNPGESALAIAGYSLKGVTSYNFQLDFTQQTDSYKFAESIWAKEMIDAIEREIEIYGETGSLKRRLIELSLKYNIRCRYTAYVADYETPFTEVDTETDPAFTLPTCYLVGNYPNPFNSETMIKFYISPKMAESASKFIKIYNSLGQLVHTIDITHLKPGFHTIRFDGKDYWGQPLPSGLYFVVLQVGDEVSTLRITIIK